MNNKLGISGNDSQSKEQYLSKSTRAFGLMISIIVGLTTTIYGESLYVNEFSKRSIGININFTELNRVGLSISFNQRLILSPTIQYEMGHNYYLSHSNDTDKTSELWKFILPGLHLYSSFIFMPKLTVSPYFGANFGITAQYEWSTINANEFMVELLFPFQVLLGLQYRIQPFLTIYGNMAFKSEFYNLINKNEGKVMAGYGMILYLPKISRKRGIMDGSAREDRKEIR